MAQMTTNQQAPDQNPDAQYRTAAVVGAGTIGLSWATLFSAYGMQVQVTDPRPDLEQTVHGTVRQFAATLPGGPRDPDELLSRIAMAAELDDAVAQADVVQENGPEKVDFKQDLFVRIEQAAPSHALLLSSSSGIMASDISRDMKDPGRVAIGHPFNPPHVIPLIEVVPGQRTLPETVEAVVAFYRWLDKVPVVLRKEIGGFVANRLQSAMFRECVSLVLKGVVTPAELDTIVSESVGPRWATKGPFESYHLGGGPGGLRHLLEHLGPGMARRWKDLGDPELSPGTVEMLSADSDDRFRGQSYEQMTENRDREQLAVLAARDAARAEARKQGA
jgi:ketoreductase RED1